MIEDLKILFRELADLSELQREGYYAKRQTPPALRAELEALLHFDGASGDSLRSFVKSVLKEFLRSNTSVSEEGPVPPDESVQ